MIRLDINGLGANNEHRGAAIDRSSHGIRKIRQRIHIAVDGVEIEPPAGPIILKSQIMQEKPLK